MAAIFFAVLFPRDRVQTLYSLVLLTRMFWLTQPRPDYGIGNEKKPRKWTIFDVAKSRRNYRKIPKFRNIALRSLQIFYVFVLRVEIVTIFEPKVVTISARSTIIQKICKLCKTIFSTHYNIF